MLKVAPKFIPELDPKFIPAVLWNKAYRSLTQKDKKSTPFAICMKRNNGAVSRFDTKVLPHTTAENKKLNIRYIERLVKYMLWMYGGQTIYLGGDKNLGNAIAKIYTKTGDRKFDFDFFSGVYQKPLAVKVVEFAKAPKKSEITVRLGGNTNGARVGFDLGGSDRKFALMVDGKVIASGETKWDPYFNTDCKYHVAGLEDTIKQACAKLPKGRKLEAIGGSSAGVIVDNQIPVASLFRGVKKANNDQMPAEALNIFVNLGKKFKVPCITINDGEVTALLGAQEQKSPSVLGISMGTSVAGGYVNPNGNITDWLNELAFVPCDYREKGPADEWSGDEGCCVQYFCQQGVARLAKQNGWKFPKTMKDPEILEKIQAEMAKGDKKAKKLYETIGIMFGYTIAHFAEFYDIKKLLILGRVTSGKGGDLILATAEKVLKAEFPALAKQIGFCIPDEKNKRHGQAAAAATLPEIKGAVAAKKATPPPVKTTTPKKATPMKKVVPTKKATPVKKAPAKKAPPAKVAAAKKTTSVKKAVSAKKPASTPVKKTVSAKKAPATKVIAKTVSVKKTVAKKAPAKTVAIKATPDKKTPVKKTVAKPAPAKKPASVKKSAPTPKVIAKTVSGKKSTPVKKKAPTKKK